MWLFLNNFRFLKSLNQAAVAQETEQAETVLFWTVCRISLAGRRGWSPLLMECGLPAPKGWELLWCSARSELQHLCFTLVWCEGPHPPCSSAHHSAQSKLSSVYFQHHTKESCCCGLLLSDSLSWLTEDTILGEKFLDLIILTELHRCVGWFQII